MKKRRKPVLSPIQPFVADGKHIEKKRKEMVKLLNEIVKVRVAPSEIHGVGVFAMRDIKEGDKVYANNIVFQRLDLPYEWFDKLRKDVREEILGKWPLIATKSDFLYPDAMLACYLNHSDTPNYDAKADKALRNIKKGEEITEDYRQIENWEKIYPWLVDKSLGNKSN